MGFEERLLLLLVLLVHQKNCSIQLSLLPCVRGLLEEVGSGPPEMMVPQLLHGCSSASYVCRVLFSIDVVEAGLGDGDCTLHLLHSVSNEGGLGRSALQPAQADDAIRPQMDRVDLCVDLLQDSLQ